MTATRKNILVQRTPDLELKGAAEIREKAMAMLRPENELEQLLLMQANFLKGLDWGMPRYGHPEGKVLLHVREVLDNVDKLKKILPAQRKRLRLITFVHDTFKYIEDKNRPRDWTRHHAAIARNFLANFTDDQATLDVTELHDEAFYAWRSIHLGKKPEQGNLRMKRLLDRIGDNLQLYYIFFKCDTRTGDKMQAPLEWFEAHVEHIEIVDF